MHYGEIRDLESVKADIAARLRTACAHFSDCEFADLVEQIAQVELKYARLAATAEATKNPSV